MKKQKIILQQEKEKSLKNAIKRILDLAHRLYDEINLSDLD